MTSDLLTEAVLRLTGEQIDSIDPPPEGDWFVDFDEYEEFVPKATLDAERARIAPLVEAARNLVQWCEDIDSGSILWDGSEWRRHWLALRQSGGTR